MPPKRPSIRIEKSNGFSNDMEGILERIRQNSVLMSDIHQDRYLFLKHILRYFRIPVIIISGFNSVLAIGLQPFAPQGTISVVNCLLSLMVGIIGSIELYLQIQAQMEGEISTSKEFYALGIEIFKVLSLERRHRSVDGKTFLEEQFSTYQKLMDKSNVIIGKKVDDKLAPLPPLTPSQKKKQEEEEGNDDMPALTEEEDFNIVV